ncbi:MAG: hypothetical protein Q9171_003018 [Xanthocarpia ochracea]
MASRTAEMLKSTLDTAIESWRAFMSKSNIVLSMSAEESREAELIIQILTKRPQKCPVGIGATSGRGMSLDVESSRRLICGALDQRAPKIKEDVKVDAKERILPATEIEVPSLNAQENLTRNTDQEVEPRLADNDSEALLSFDDPLLAGGGETRSAAAQPAIAQDEERTQQ